jgi:type IV secretion system protein VirD4
MKEETLKKNIIVNGDIQSGKTKNAMFPIVEEIINKNESLMILDAKEEYINQYYDKLKESNYNIIILNFRDLELSEGWNPLEYPYNLYKNGNKDKAVEYIEKIGKTLYQENISDDPFWASSASDFFTGTCIALFEDGANLSEINFNSINAMFNTIDKKLGKEDYLTTYIKSKGNSSQAYTYASSTILSPSETKGGILSVAKQNLRLLVSRDKLSKLMNKTTFDIKSISSTKTALIVIGKDEDTTLNKIITIFIEQLYSILIDNKVSIKFNFVLDNFDIIEKSNRLIDMLSSCLSRNMKFYIATRSIDELISVYGTYIKKLCDEISIDDVDKKEIKEINSNITYPKLEETTIELFNLIKKVDKQLSEEYGDESLDVTKRDIKVNDLIKEIDEKIKEIEM